jgi:sigma-B regulation protein RsbU (phosphoserine phosphatase)
LAAGSIALTRQRRGVRIFVWLGLWSALYGAAQLAQSPAVAAALPRWLQAPVPVARAAISYVLIVPALLAFGELSLGAMRALVRGAAAVAAAIAVCGIAAFATTGATGGWMVYNNLLAAGMLMVLTAVVAVPRLAARYLALPDRRVLVGGVLVFALEALYNSLSQPLGLPSSRVLDHVGFAVLLASFGYVALQLVFSNERRLLAVDEELAIASRMQMSILPDGAPVIPHLRMSAAYKPMTAVAGDFYDFIPSGTRRVGVLVADVAGHGVAAALVASMIKVAIQSVAERAEDPAAVLRGLNRALSAQPGSQLISAAYLFIDPDGRQARYSAAGHPPLLAWRNGAFERVMSNGLLIGMIPEADYPVATLAIGPGDRFLLYTDGVTDAESAEGEFFGDARLEVVVRGGLSQPPRAFADLLVAEVGRWLPGRVPQQDDITVVVVDVDGPAATGLPARGDAPT